MTHEAGESAARTIETAGPVLARLLFGWDGPMWRYRNPWGPWTQGEPPPVSDRNEAESYAERSGIAPCPHHPEGCIADPREGQDFDWRDHSTCPTCGSGDPMFRRNRWWKGEFAGVCTDPWHPIGAGSPGREASYSGRSGGSDG